MWIKRLTLHVPSDVLAWPGSHRPCLAWLGSGQARPGQCLAWAGLWLRLEFLKARGHGFGCVDTAHVEQKMEQLECVLEGSYRNQDTVDPDDDKEWSWDKLVMIVTLKIIIN